MSNMLDLKHPEPVERIEAVSAQSTLPAQPFSAAEIASVLIAGGPEEVSWEAHHALPDHAHGRRRLLMLAVAVVGVAAAWWQSSWLTLLAIAAGLGAWELRERCAHSTRVAINSSGVWVDGTHFPHSELASFDIHRLPDDSFHVSIHTNKRFTPRIHIPLGAQHPDDVRAVLARYVPEEHHDAPLFEWWLRRR